MKDQAQELIKAAEELTPELSKGMIAYDHRDILYLLCTCKTLEVQKRILAELHLINHERRMKMNPMSMMNPFKTNEE